MFKLKKIYIVLTHTGTNLSKIIKSWTKDEFSHVSIALDEDLKEIANFKDIVKSYLKMERIANGQG